MYDTGALVPQGRKRLVALTRSPTVRTLAIRLAASLALLVPVANLASAQIRKVTRDGVITTIAGTGERGYNGDGGPARGFHLRFPARVAAYSDRKVLVSDTLNHRVRVLTVEFPPPVVSSVLDGASYSASLAPGSVSVIQGADLSS